MFTYRTGILLSVLFSSLAKKRSENIMADVRVMKRGKVYQYQFEIAPVNGTRKYINKSGFFPVLHRGSFIGI
jgi:hypothetical protein